MYPFVSGLLTSSLRFTHVIASSNYFSLLCSIPPYNYTTIYLSFLLMGVWIASGLTQLHIVL